jgi:hypothetical protein
MLSKENYDKLNANYLYKKKNEIWNGIGDKRWCKNWTFVVRKHDDGSAVMLDSYYKSYDSHSYHITDKNIDEFYKVFDFREVKRIHDDEVDEYNEEDLFRVATDSGGYYCGKLYWVRKDVEKARGKLIEKAKYKVERAKSNLEHLERHLENLLNN